MECARARIPPPLLFCRRCSSCSCWRSVVIEVSRSAPRARRRSRPPTSCQFGGGIAVSASNWPVGGACDSSLDIKSSNLARGGGEPTRSSHATSLASAPIWMARRHKPLTVSALTLAPPCAISRPEPAKAGSMVPSRTGGGHAPSRAAPRVHPEADLHLRPHGISAAQSCQPYLRIVFAHVLASA